MGRFSDQAKSLEFLKLVRDKLDRLAVAGIYAHAAKDLLGVQNFASLEHIHQSSIIAMHPWSINLLKACKPLLVDLRLHDFKVGFEKVHFLFELAV